MKGRDIIIVLLVILVAYLLFRDITNDRKIEYIDASSAGITMTSDGITFNKPVVFNEKAECKKDLFVGTGNNKWHMRDTRLGITGKFDFVPGFTTGSTANDNWIRLLEYDNKDASKYWGEGLASNKVWANQIGFGGKRMSDDGVAIVFRGTGIGDRIAIFNNNYRDI